MDDVMKDMLAEPDRWIGGELVNFGVLVKLAPEEEFWPMRTRIRLVQLEDLKRFTVIGEKFSCNGELAFLKVASHPRFPATQPGEIVFQGEAHHEWHVVPRSLE